MDHVSIDTWMNLMTQVSTVGTLLMGLSDRCYRSLGTFELRMLVQVSLTLPLLVRMSSYDINTMASDTGFDVLVVILDRHNFLHSSRSAACSPLEH